MGAEICPRLMRNPKIAELTVSQLQQMIRQTVHETVAEMMLEVSLEAERERVLDQQLEVEMLDYLNSLPLSHVQARYDD
jgi:hypothetical protein